MDFSFEIKPEITKEFLLSKYSEETYMEYYLGIPVTKKLVVNPLRVDNKPTASFFRNKKNELIFKDFGWDFYGNFISVVMYKYNCNYHDALTFIAQDFGLIPSKSKPNVVIKESNTKFTSTGPSKIQIEQKNYSKNELNWWEQYGITLDILKKFKVYCCNSIFLNDKLFAQSTSKCPIFGYYLGKNNDDELWRIYFPKKKTYRFISNTTSKKIQGFKQLPKNGKLLVITKSMKDVMCLYSLGIPAIAPNSENLFISKEILDNLKSRFKNIVVFYDVDIAGLSNMKKIKQDYPELIYTWIPRKYNTKDISDFYKEYGRNNTLKLIKNFIIWLHRH